MSSYYLTEELSGTYRGMMIALPPDDWSESGTLSVKQFARQLLSWARKIDLTRYRKRPRGPKTRPQREFKQNKHVATARLLAARKPRRKLPAPSP